MASLLPIHELFEAQARALPDAVAIRCSNGVCWTYDTLRRHVNQIARWLGASGITVGARVALFVGRKPESIAAMLAVLKSGAAYVPIDGSTPPARVRTLVQLIRPAAVITDRLHWQAALSDDVHPLPHDRVLCLDAQGSECAPGVCGLESLESQSDDSFPSLAGLDDCAYVIFTSGSTGTPKGVVVRHRAASGLLNWVNRTFAIEPGDTLLFITSFAFDLSVYDIFGTLAAGATVRLADEQDVHDPARLLSILRDEPITFWDSAPAALQRLLPLCAQALLPVSDRLRLVFLSGDWVPLSMPPALWRHFPRARVVALGGATEATVWSNYFPVDRIDPAWTSIPYGKPIPNARYYILDCSHQPCPVGEDGDLYIAGECLADGYFDAPALTAERFMEDPFVTAGQRMYRTGDRARWMPDSNIEFRGRVDGQVKVRGFRVELAEIEACLKKDAAVLDTVVLARDLPERGKQLIAFVCLAPGNTSAPAALRDHLSRQLPAYMVPSVFIAVDRFPLSTSGKVDRRELLALAARSAHETDELLKTDRERILAAIWSGVLGVERIGRSDNFFTLGGDSLTCVDLVCRARLAGLELNTGDVFRHSTLQGLAAVARRLEPCGHSRGAPGAVPRLMAGDGKVPLTPIQRWLFDRGLRDVQNYNIAMLYEVRKDADLAQLLRSLSSAARRHDAFGLRFEKKGGVWRQTIAAADEPVIAITRQRLDSLNASEAVVHAEQALHQLRRDLDLARGPLLKAILFETSFGAWLGIVAHHLVLDGVSLRIFLGEVQAAYRHEGESERERPAGDGFVDWARRLAAYSESRRVWEHLEGWLALPWEQVRPLPCDFRNGINTYASSADAHATLDVARTKAVLHLAPIARGTSAGEVLLAAFGRAAAGWAHTDAVLVEVAGHGREPYFDDFAVSHTIGYITTNSPVILGAGDAQPPSRPWDQSWGLLNYSRQPGVAKRVRQLPPAQLKFNFQGSHEPPGAEPLLAPTSTGVRGVLEPSNPRAYWINIEVWIAEGRLQCACKYGRNLHRPESAERLLGLFIGELARVAHCVAPFDTEPRHHRLMEAHQ